MSVAVATAAAPALSLTARRVSSPMPSTVPPVSLTVPTTLRTGTAKPWNDVQHTGRQPHFDRDLAREVVGELFGDSDEQALAESALERRPRGKPERLKDPKERRKMLAYLVRQGFSPSCASSVMRAKWRPVSQ